MLLWFVIITTQTWFFILFCELLQHIHTHSPIHTYTHTHTHTHTQGSLGLIGDHRKFNVAVTRGKALCVLIGQPYLLYSDPVWKEFLEYCDINGTIWLTYIYLSTQTELLTHTHTYIHRQRHKDIHRYRHRHSHWHIDIDIDIDTDTQSKAILSQSNWEKIL